MKALLDACVLYPTLTRGLLIDAATAGLFAPLWSARILAEWRHAAARQPGMDDPGTAAALMGARWPGAEVAVPEALEAGLSLPDPDDTHVLAAAIAGGADALVTFNLRDFPARTLARDGITLWHPDALLAAFVQEAPDTMRKLAEAQTAPLTAAGMTPRAALKKVRLPRLGKAIERLG